MRRLEGGGGGEGGWRGGGRGGGGWRVCFILNNVLSPIGVAWHSDARPHDTLGDI